MDWCIWRIICDSKGHAHVTIFYSGDMEQHIYSKIRDRLDQLEFVARQMKEDLANNHMTSLDSRLSQTITLWTELVKLKATADEQA